MRVWTRVDAGMRSIDRLAVSIASLAEAIRELARVQKAHRR